MMEMVINGVSTRKVSAITEELCGTSFSKSLVSSLCEKLDPQVYEFRNRPLKKHYLFVIVDTPNTKSRIDNRFPTVAPLMASEVSEKGYREVLGFWVADRESENSWSSLTGLLKNVDYLISDNYPGL